MNAINLRSLVFIAWLLAIVTMLIPRAGQADLQDRDLAERARDILDRRCYQCHGQGGVARKNIYVIDRDRLIASRTVVPGDPGSLLLKVVESRAMPIGGPELEAEEKAALRNWVVNGAPAWSEAAVERSFITESSILDQIQSDLSTTTERSRAYLRYFSISHLYNARVPESELEDYRGAISKLINSLSRRPDITRPFAIDTLRTVFRIDLRDYDWTSATWNQLIAGYPYAVRTSDAETINRLSGSFGVPYLRADWFVAKASASPLYYQLLNLPATLLELERQLGIDVDRDLVEEKNVIRAGIRTSGVSQNNRILERHVSPHGAYWKSFDFRNNLNGQNIFRDPLRFSAAGSEIIFNLPNGLQAYYLADSRGVRLNGAPINIVADRNNPDDPVIINGRSCMSCHFAGMKTLKDDVRPVVDNLNLADPDRDRVLALYSMQETIDKWIEKDSERFKTALEKTGARLPRGTNTESISALSRKFHAELSVSEAAAEAGLEVDEFQSRLKESPRLTSLGFGQLLVSGGAIKRELWDRAFVDVVRELRLGDHLSPALSAAQLPQAPQVAPIQLRVAAEGFIRPVAGAHAPSEPFADGLRFARKILILTRTAHFNPDELARELATKSEFAQMGLSVTKDRNDADLILQVNRIFLSARFPYAVFDPRTRRTVAEGQVSSVFGSVPSRIADKFIKQVKEARASTALR